MMRKRQAPAWVIRALINGEDMRDEGETGKLSRWMQQHPDAYGVDTHSDRSWSEIFGRQPTERDLARVMRRAEKLLPIWDRARALQERAEAQAEKANERAEKAERDADAAFQNFALAEDEEQLIRDDMGLPRNEKRLT